MGLFGKILKTGLDVATTPLGIAKDLLQGEDLDDAIRDRAERVSDDVEEVRDALDGV